jgi:5-oxopent-3-ene-1,2,5-tricarboxylate decarboxylase/2-hydroxyhepta-2,4-diene-1,7-dioate isomerase
MRRARISRRGEPAHGTLDGDVVELTDGTRVPVAEAEWLSPVEPSKVVATHLSYRSRCEEYQMAVSCP